MPRKRQSTKRKRGGNSGYSKRSRRSTYRSRRSRAIIPRHRPLFPRVFTTDFKYACSLNLGNLTSGTTYDQHIFWANSVYDCTFTGTAVESGEHQPMGFDQIAPRYDHFVVNYATITASFGCSQKRYTGDAGENDTDELPIRCMIALRDTPSELVNAADTPLWSTVVESGNSLYRYIPDASKMATIRLKYNKYKMFGKKANDKDMFGTGVSNPQEGAYFIIGVNSMNPGYGKTPHCHVDVQIKYNVTFVERKPMAQS